MMQNLEQIEYRRGMLEARINPTDLPVKVWKNSKIPAEIRKAIHEQDILNLRGRHGDKTLGDPVEYDYLKLKLTDDVVEIEVYNRGITLLMKDDEIIRRLHRVLCKLDKV